MEVGLWVVCDKAFQNMWVKMTLTQRSKSAWKILKTQNAHFLSSVTSLPVPSWDPVGVSVGLCQVWWQSDNSPARESQIRVTSGFMRSLPVLGHHFRYHYGLP